MRKAEKILAERREAIDSNLKDIIRDIIKNKDYMTREELYNEYLSGDYTNGKIYKYEMKKFEIQIGRGMSRLGYKLRQYSRKALVYYIKKDIEPTEAILAELFPKKPASENNKSSS